MDDLVVIILTILIAVVGIISQSKKRKDMQAAGKQQQNKPMDFWELLEQESNRANPFQPFGPTETEPEEEEVDIVPEKKPEYQFKAQDEGSSDIVEEVKEEPRQIKKDVLIDGEKFSLRKAVIYNEIMNRKYF